MDRHDPSFFSILTRYRPNGARLPEEDSLTQCFAALLHAVPELALVAAAEWSSGWTDREVHDVEATTQVKTATDSLRRIDLQLVLPGNDTLVWVEVKHRAPLSGEHQLRDYWADLRMRPNSRRALIFLPRAGFALTENQQPPDDGETQRFFESDWQQTGRCIERWLCNRDRDLLEGYLANHFLEFLKEEGLFVTRGFSSADETTLTEHAEAASAFARLISEVRSRVDQRVRDEGLASGSAKTWPSRPRWGHLGAAWAMPSIGDRDQPWLEWQFNNWDAETDRTRWVFSAGISAHRQETLPEIQSQADDDAAFRVFEDGSFRFMKHLELADVEKRAKDPEEQVQLVAEHIINSLQQASAAWRAGA